VLDPFTLVVLQGMGAAMSGVVLAAANANDPQRATKLGLWSCVALMGGSLLMLLRPVVPTGVSVVAGSAFIMVAVALCAEAYRRFAHRPSALVFRLTTVGAASVVLAVMVLMGAQYAARAIVVSCVLVGFLGLAGWELLRTESGPREQTRWFSVVLVGFAAASLFVRTALLMGTAATGEVNPSLFDPSLERTLAFFPGILLSMGYGPGLLLMNHERRANDARRLATIDPLTGVLNRRALIERVNVEFAGARRRGEPCSLLMLDIDHFKSVNDQYGHAGGDAVLVEFAQRLVDHVRPTDLVARLGGEEFCIFLSGASEEASLHVADRLRRLIASTPMTLPNGERLSVRMSVGSATVESVAEPHWQSLLEHADRALYVAKSQGRDRVVAASRAGGPTE
jgi:diguanylate cyclase (GGDEF)-like protein